MLQNLSPSWPTCFIVALLCLFAWLLLEFAEDTKLKGHFLCCLRYFWQALVSTQLKSGTCLILAPTQHPVHHPQCSTSLESWDYPVPVHYPLPPEKTVPFCMLLVFPVAQYHLLKSRKGEWEGSGWKHEPTSNAGVSHELYWIGKKNGMQLRTTQAPLSTDQIQAKPFHLIYGPSACFPGLRKRVQLQTKIKHWKCRKKRTKTPTKH